jgi:hypothetical protein
LLHSFFFFFFFFFFFCVPHEEEQPKPFYLILFLFMFSLWRNQLALSDCGSEGLGFDPHSGQSKVRLFSLSILTEKIVLVVQSGRVPTPPSTGSLVSV